MSAMDLAGVIRALASRKTCWLSLYVFLLPIDRIAVLFSPSPLFFSNLLLADNNAHGDDSQLLGGVSTVLHVDGVTVTLHGT
jgi:hypothetical protein